MNKIWFVYALIGIMLGAVSCSKDNDKENETEEIDIVGTWIASSGKYNLSLEITPSGYDFLLSEPGKGGVTDKGTYEISGDGKITFTNKNSLLATGQLKNEKLSLTFIHPSAIMMLGTAASNITFTLSDEESYGFIVVQNLSESYDIVTFKFYDGNGNYLDSDSDVLEPDYEFSYEVPLGNYIIEITDSRGKSFKSKSFSVVKDKSTILGYNGSALNILATGVDNSKYAKSITSNTIHQSIPTMAKSKKMYSTNY